MEFFGWQKLIFHPTGCNRLLQIRTCSKIWMPGSRPETNQTLMKILLTYLTRLLVLVALFCASSTRAADKKIVLIAGQPSHGPGDHEFRAGCLLLKKCLDQVQGISSVVYSDGWPNRADAFHGADAVLIYADG